MFDVKEFLIVLIEKILIFTLWSQIGIDWRKDRLKIITAIPILSILMLPFWGSPFISAISALIYFAYVKVVFRKSIQDTLIEGIIVLTASQIIAIPSLLLFYKYINTPSLQKEATILFLSVAAISGFVVIKVFPISKLYYKYKNLMQKAAFILLNYFILQILFNYYYFKYGKADIFSMLIFTVALMASSYASFIMFKELGEQQKLVEHYKQQENTVAPLIDEIRSRQHDFKNQLNAIYGMWQMRDQGAVDIGRYIETLNDSLRNMEMLIPIKDKVIAGMIYSKACEAHASGIDFNYELPPHEVTFPMKYYEYASVLGNLLDNAFEAVATAEVKKQVTLKLYEDASLVCLEVSNTGRTIDPKILSHMFNKGFTTKKGKDARGYGLYTVKKICDAYAGIIEVMQDGDITLFRICFEMA